MVTDGGGLGNERLDGAAGEIHDVTAANRSRTLALVALFTATALSSATLLFWIQPLFTKTLLPMLGGAPVVWNTALVFFQLVLLAGYGYAHLVGRWFSPGVQVLVHLGVCFVAFTFLPVDIAGAYTQGQNPIVALIALLAVSIGPPVFVISATAPLIQRWFANTEHPGADDPYFLYAASNVGSIVALLAFPFVLEPLATLVEQRRAWSAGFVILAALLAMCGLVMLRSVKGTCKDEQSLNTHVSVSWRQRLSWVALAAVPSSLLLGVTQHITTDIASVPLLWIIPLLIYLLTFVLAFSRTKLVKDRWIHQGQAFFLAVAGVWIWTALDIRYMIALHLSILFVLALSCHWELARKRPAVENLTQFYLYVSLGGLLGGAFNTILAPLIFQDTLEYGLAVALACMLRPGEWRGKAGRMLMDCGFPAIMLGGGLGFMALVSLTLPALYSQAFIVLLLGFVIIGFSFKERPLRYGLTALALLLAGASVSTDATVLEQRRSYFGSYDIVFSGEDNANLMFHGTTIHGAQLLEASLLAEPTSYYTEHGPLGQAFSVLRKEHPEMSVGLVGLGIGAALCYSRPGDTWQVFEIDPLVVELASDTRYFHQWDKCASRTSTDLLLGDARIALRTSDRSFDVLILDAYTSDAIPVHLMTLEALELYRQRLRPSGVLLFHISNRHLSLDRVLSSLAKETGMSALIQEHQPADAGNNIATASMWVALAEESEDLARLRSSGNWEALPSKHRVLWTDDYSDVLSVLR